MLLELKVRKDQQAIPVLRVLKVLLDLKVQPGHKALLALKVLKAFKVHRVY